MATGAGTLELLVRELATALRPLEQRLAPGQRDAFFAELGLRLPSGLDSAAGAVGVLVQQVGGLGPILVRLTDAIEAGEPGPIIQAGVDLLGVVRLVLDAVDDLEPALSAAVTASGGLTPAQRERLQELVRELPRRLLDVVLLSYVESKSAGALDLLTVAGVVDDVPQPPDPADPTVLPVRRRALHIDRLLRIFTDPTGWLRDTFDLGSPAFDGLKLWPRIGAFLDRAGLPFELIVPPSGPPVLEAFLLRLSVDPTASPPAATARLRIPATFDVDLPVLSGPLWTVEATARSRWEAGLEARIAAPLDLELRALAGPLQLEASTGVRAERGGQPILLLGRSGGSRLEFTRFAASLGLRATATVGQGVTVEPVAGLELDGGRMVIDLSSGDGFISTVTGGTRIDSTFSLRAQWTPSGGLKLQGGAALELAIPTHLDLGPIEVTTLYVAAGPPRTGALPIEASGSFTAALGPVKAAVDRVGLVVDLGFPDGGGNLGPVDVAFSFKPPNGIGLAIDAGIVAGGGYLFADRDRGEYAGALELQFADFLELKAIGLISTRMPDGSTGFSLLIVITAEFGGGGIQLGYGFKLLAVGGMIGLNRGMNLQALVEGLRAGAIDSVMFPRDVVANAPRILSDLRTFFPPEQGTFLIGPMAKLGWGTPTLVSVSLGVIVEIPGNLAILGVLRAVLPTKELPLLVLQVGFVGAIEFEKERLWFFAQLFDSRVLTMTLGGGMGLLVAWGDNPDFVLTVGGFHPAYRPPPLPFPVPDRLSVDILNRPGALIRVSGYFAITSNTVQFGARAELRLGFDDFGIEGHVAFDALFQFSPFRFVISISASVSLKAFGVGLFSIHLRFQLEGPAPWRAHGRGSIGFLFFEISADFDITWGEERDTTLPPVDVLPLLATEMSKVEGWQTRLPAGRSALVSLRQLPPTDELVLHPLGTLVVRQRALPLDVRLDRVGAQKVRDGKRFGVAPAPDSGLVQVAVASDKFAMAQYQDMPDAAKLSLPAYADQDAGLELAGVRGVLASARALRRSARYEQIVIDSRPRAAGVRAAGALPAVGVRAAGVPAPRKLTRVSPAVFGQLLAGSSASRSVLSHQDAQRRQPFAEADTVRVPGPRFVVAYVRNNLQAFAPSGLARTLADAIGAGAAGVAGVAGVASAGTVGGALLGAASATFRSHATAADALADWVAADPSLAGALHVIPAANAAAPPAVPGVWSTVGALPSAASWDTAADPAVRLGNGRLLVAGGTGSGGEPVDAVALFDPVSNVWSAGPALVTARHGHTTTRLADGRILVAGGLSTSDSPTGSVESYDPLADAWSAAPTGLGTARYGHSATRLADGRVLVAGGTASRGTDGIAAALVSAERFDPATGAWTTVAPMTDARTGHQAVLLPDGRVLVIGGLLLTGGPDPAGAPLAYCELFDPQTGDWTAAGSLGTPRVGHQATLLADGTVLVTGGDAAGVDADGVFDPGSRATAERYDPGTDVWSPAASMPGPRTRHRAVLLRSGRVLVAGGTAGPGFTGGYRSVLTYDPVSDRWTETGALALGRWAQATAELADGRVVAAGGTTVDGAAAPGPEAAARTASTEIFTP